MVRRGRRVAEEEEVEEAKGERVKKWVYCSGVWDVESELGEVAIWGKDDDGYADMIEDVVEDWDGVGMLLFGGQRQGTLAVAMGDGGKDWYCWRA